MSVLRVLSSEGDYATHFTNEAHSEAKRLFEKLGVNYTAFRIEPGKPAVRLTEFESGAEEIIMVPKIVGG